jgi:hypothetical protein
MASAYAQQGNSGAIWTTQNDCGTEQQNVNRYVVGEVIYINGRNFNTGTYDWTLTQPGTKEVLVASGTLTIDASGAFCIPGYTVQASDTGEYSIKVGNKNDNFQTTTTIIIANAIAAGTTTTTTTTTVAPVVILPVTGTDLIEQQQQTQRDYLNLSLAFLAASLIALGFWLKRTQKVA